MPGLSLPIAIRAYTATSAAGVGVAALLEALRARRSGLRENDLTRTPLACWIGRVAALETVALPRGMEHWDSRCHRLAWLGVQQDGFLEAFETLRLRHKPERIGLLLGTSTSSIDATERAYRELDADGRFPAFLRGDGLHAPHAVAGFLQHVLQIAGPCVTVATACSSSAKVFAQAERWLRTGLVDVAVVGGVDSLCDSVLFGFHSLELVSSQPCRPFDSARHGLSLGEAAGFAILQRAVANDNFPRLLGYGESSDAFHMSAPHPEGLGVRRAVNDALARAGLKVGDIDYINLHGTASEKNDAVEATLIAELFPASTLASSTKGWTGHTLGAAGIVEATISLLALEHGLAPGILHTEMLDAQCGPQIRIENTARPLRYALSNSFGFGGNNVTLVFERRAQI